MLAITCPFCGTRPESEFYCIGEGLAMIPSKDMDADALQNHLYFRENPRGLIQESWVHRYGCGQWLTVHRDTRSNLIESVSYLNETTLCTGSRA